MAVFSSFTSQAYSKAISGATVLTTENIILIKGICLSFIENFDDPNEKNLLFTGNTGLR